MAGESSGPKLPWQCVVCGYIYDPRRGDDDGEFSPGTAFEDLPDNWLCPVCGVGKNLFEMLGGLAEDDE